MRKSLLFLLFSISLFYAQNVGINIDKPDPSAILEVSADAPPTSTQTTKRGLLLPRVALSSNLDVTTIPNPAKGLMIINTADSGTYPNEVVANRFYYWNGVNWERLPYTSVVEEAVKPRIFYAEGSDTQSFLETDINCPSNTACHDLATNANLKYFVVTFTSSIINVKNIVTLNTDSSITINESGIYDVSGFVNYNPMSAVSGSSNNDRAFLNLKIQKLNTATGLYEDQMGSRTGWGNGMANRLKTAVLQSTPLELKKNDKIRLVGGNPFTSSSGNNHGGLGNPYLGTDSNSHITISKGLRIQLLDFNIK